MPNVPPSEPGTGTNNEAVHTPQVMDSCKSHPTKGIPKLETFAGEILTAWSLGTETILPRAEQLGRLAFLVNCSCHS
jgi:hypothetical protein